MSRRRVALHELTYERLSEAEKRLPHPPIPMRSGNSHGPIKMWVCNQPFCEGIEYTYKAPHTPPICFGGMKWSFSTDGSFDPRRHHPWAR